MTSGSVESDEVEEVHFEVDGPRGPVPTVQWKRRTPRGPEPLILLGHGASSSKTEGYVASFARSLVRNFGATAVAIDGPLHGGRRSDGGANPAVTFLEFTAAWSSRAELTDEMVDDWRAALDAVLARGGIDAEKIGYWGLSMGTIFGLPFVAAEPRVRAAVLGLMGTAGPTRERIAHDAAAIVVPTMFLVQWDDELFDRASAFDLFDRLASTDKVLHANPGRHGAVPPAEFAQSATFLLSRLGANGNAAN